MEDQEDQMGCATTGVLSLAVAAGVSIALISVIIILGTILISGLATS